MAEAAMKISVRGCHGAAVVIDEPGALSAEQRFELMALCCRGCGGVRLRCHCDRAG